MIVVIQSHYTTEVLRQRVNAPEPTASLKETCMEENSTPHAQRVCTKCKNQYPSTAKYFNRRSDIKGGGLRSECKQCSYDAQQTEKSRESAKHWRTERKKSPPTMLMEGERNCRKCKQDKSVMVFRPHIFCVGGRIWTCDDCRRASRQEHRINEWWKPMLKNAEERSKNRGWQIDIDHQYILQLFEQQNQRCFWFGTPFVITARRNPQKPSLDRLDCRKGYVRGNVVLASQVANLGRSNFTPEVFATFVANLKKALNHSEENE